MKHGSRCFCPPPTAEYGHNGALPLAHRRHHLCLHDAPVPCTRCPPGPTHTPRSRSCCCPRTRPRSCRQQAGSMAVRHGAATSSEHQGRAELARPRPLWAHRSPLLYLNTPRTWHLSSFTSPSYLQAEAFQRMLSQPSHQGPPPPPGDGTAAATASRPQLLRCTARCVGCASR